MVSNQGYSDDDLFDLFGEPQRDEIAPDDARAVIDQLISDTRLYTDAKAQRDLFDFVARFREYAPFNAMLMHIQKPGLTYAATARDWQRRFRRRVKKDARPLIILQPFGPVNFVFDIQDTEGDPVPEGVFKFEATGDLPVWWLGRARKEMKRRHIDLDEIDVGDGSAGYIELVADRRAKKQANIYRVAVNRNHSAPSQFTTVAHELAHLFLGHLGPDPKRSVKDRTHRTHAQAEVEAESAAYLVAKRAGVTPRSDTYLERYQGSFADIDLHTIMRATSEIERAMTLPYVRGWQA